MFINRAYLGPHSRTIVLVIIFRNLLGRRVGQLMEVLGKDVEVRVNKQLK